MVVVSDTSAITNLIQIGLLSKIKELYGQLIIPQAVYDELVQYSDQKTLMDEQDWIVVRQIQNQQLYVQLRTTIDVGEAEAIVLSLESKADLLIIDERKGRKLAKQHGLRIIGLLGVLAAAKKKGLVLAIEPYLRKLRDEVGFRISSELYQQILKQVGERN